MLQAGSYYDIWLDGEKWYSETFEVRVSRYDACFLRSSCGPSLYTTAFAQARPQTGSFDHIFTVCCGGRPGLLCFLCQLAQDWMECTDRVSSALERSGQRSRRREMTTASAPTSWAAQSRCMAHSTCPASSR